MKIKMKCVVPGTWEVLNIQRWNGRVFAVLMCHAPRVYELQDKHGNTVFNDGFESLSHVRAYFNQRNAVL